MTAVLLAAIVVAAEPNPISVRSWQLAASRELAVAARENPLTRVDAQFALLPGFVPKRPVTYRARIQSLDWKDGVVRAGIGQPLGWTKSRAGTGPYVAYTPRVFFEADADAASSIRLGQVLIVTAPLKLSTNEMDYRRTLQKTTYVLFTLQITPAKIGTFYSDKITYVINGTSYKPVYNRIY